MFRRQPRNGNGHSHELPPEADVSTPVVVEPDVPAPLRVLSKVPAWLAALGVGVVVGAAGGGFAIGNRAGCGTSRSYVDGVVATASAAVPKLAERLDRVESASVVNAAQHEAIIRQLDRIEARLNSPAGKVTP